MSDELENEVLYEFEMRNSKDSYIKPLYGKISKKFRIFNRIMAVVFVAEVIAMIIVGRSASLRADWIIILFVFIFIFVLMPFLQRLASIKHYEKIHAAEEDRISYAFYNDRVKLKSPTVEAELKYDTAEFLAENSKRLMITFSFKRVVCIEKDQCNEEILAFLRGIVPAENQKKTEKKALVRNLIVSVAILLYTVLLAVLIVRQINIKANTYYPQYPETTYESFEACLDYGLVKDVVIIKDEYIEYTFTGRGEDEQYYTVYPDDDIDWLTDKLNALDVDWKFE